MSSPRSIVRNDEKTAIIETAASAVALLICDQVRSDTQTNNRDAKLPDGILIWQIACGAQAETKRNKN